MKINKNKDYQKEDKENKEEKEDSDASSEDITIAHI